MQSVLAVMTKIIIIVAEALGPKSFWMVALEITSTLSGPELRTLSGGKGLSTIVSLNPGASPQPVFHYLRLLLAKGTQWVCGGFEEICVGFQKRSGTDSEACTFANAFAVFKPGKHTIYFRCPPRWWWICECSTDEGSLG